MGGWLFILVFDFRTLTNCRLSESRSQVISVRISNMGKITTPGGRLRAFRSERGLTGTALAETLGCTKSTISYWEAGRTTLPWTACLALEAAHGVSAQWLASGEGPMWLVPGRLKTKVRKSLHSIPFLEGQLGFRPDGSVQAPHSETPGLGFPPSLLLEVAGDPLPGPEDLYLWRVKDPEMAPLLPEGAWVLLNVAATAREPLTENAIYLVRLGQEQSPCLRRVAIEPLSGDLLVSTDAPRRVPLRIARTVANGEFSVLARAIWAGVGLLLVTQA